MEVKCQKVTYRGCFIEGKYQKDDLLKVFYEGKLQKGDLQKVIYKGRHTKRWHTGREQHGPIQTRLGRLRARSGSRLPTARCRSGPGG